MELTQTVLALEDINGWVDFWRYEVGMNVIPAISKEKRPIVEWKAYQTQPIPQYQHEEWKDKHLFDEGFAVILGTVWYRKDLEGYNLSMIDGDNALAFQELFGTKGNINQFAKQHLIELHKDDYNRTHVYIYTIGDTLREKTSDKGRLPEGVDINSIPAFEVKPNSKYLSYPCPNFHKNGCRYEIVDSLNIPVFSDIDLETFQRTIDNVMKKYNLSYGGQYNERRIPIEELFKPGCPILEGHNRHEALLRMLGSLIARLRTIMSMEAIKTIAKSYDTSEYVNPPLNEREFESLWQQAEKFIAKNNSSIGGAQSKQKEKTDSKEKSIKKYQVYKCSKKDGLVEEIQLAGQKVFIQIKDGTPTILEEIDLSEEKGIIVEPHKSVGNQIMPYSYDNIEEIQHFIELAQGMHIDDLYYLVKSIWSYGVYTKEKELITLLATDTITSYFQEKFVTTHYLLVSGPPGWGKGVILLTFKLLGYRVVLAGDMSGANVLDLLGPIEKCQISIAEDEFDNIHKDPDKERIMKMGYEDIGQQITRTVDPSSSERRLVLYNPYCFKIFAGEKAPDLKELGGFNDRLFRAEVKKGKPKINMKEVKNQMELPKEKQLPKYRKIIDRIHFLRKILPIYKLLHYDDVIDEVNTNITGRPLELTGQGLRLFHSDKLSDGRAFDEVRNALTHFLRKKGELDKKSIESVTFDVLKKLFADIEQGIIEDRKDEKIDLDGNNTTLYKLTFDEICQTVMDAVDGTAISARTFESAEYPKVTHDSLLEICRGMFGGTDKRVRVWYDNHNKSKEKKAIEFNKKVVEEAGKNFESITDIEVYEAPNNEELEEDPQIGSMWAKAMLLSTNFEKGGFSS